MIRNGVDDRIIDRAKRDGLDNSIIPIQYGIFRNAVLNGEQVINKYIEMEMNRIDKLIDDPNIFYDARPLYGYVAFIEAETTLTDGSKNTVLPSFKLWAEQLLCWFYYEYRTKYDSDGKEYVVLKKKRLTLKQYLIVSRGGAKSMYASGIHAKVLCSGPKTTHNISTAPTMRQAEETVGPIKTAMLRHPGPLLTLLTKGSLHNTTGSKLNRPKLYTSGDTIYNDLTGSKLEVRAMSIDKMQGMRPFLSSVDEWLSGDIREDVVGAIEQGASKLDDYMIICTSSEGTVRNGAGDDIKKELIDILNGEYEAPHVSIWYYRLDSVEEVGIPEAWPKCNPNIGITVDYAAYYKDVERAENAPAAKNDILAKRFGIPSEGYTYFFPYAETIPHKKHNYWGMQCSLGGDMSKGDDFCAFVFLFPLPYGRFGVKARCYISERTMTLLPPTMYTKYQTFIKEGSLIVLNGSILDMEEVYEEVDDYIVDSDYDVCSFGYDPYNAKAFVERYILENGEFGVEKVRQGVITESVPLGEIKALTEDRMLIFDQEIISFALQNAIVLEDTNGNRKLFKKRREDKIDPVASLIDAWVGYKRCPDKF